MATELPNTCDKCATPDQRGPLLFEDSKTKTATCSRCGYVHKVTPSVDIPEKRAADTLLSSLSVYAMYDRLGEDFTDAFIEELMRISDGEVQNGWKVDGS